MPKSNVPTLKFGIRPQRMSEIAKLVAEGKVPANKETAKHLIDSLSGADRPAEQAATDLGLIQSTDTSAIDAAIDALIAQNPKPLQDYRAGKQTAMGALVGMVMKSGKGFNAKLVQEQLKKRL